MKTTIIALLIALGACAEPPATSSIGEALLASVDFTAYTTTEITALETGAGCPGKPDCGIYDDARYGMAIIDGTCIAHNGAGQCITSSIEPGYAVPLAIACGKTVDGRYSVCACYLRIGKKNFFYSDAMCDGVGSWVTGGSGWPCDPDGCPGTPPTCPPGATCCDIGLPGCG